jgi:hypothetical protein
MTGKLGLRHDMVQQVGTTDSRTGTEATEAES